MENTSTHGKADEERIDSGQGPINPHKPMTPEQAARLRKNIPTDLKETGLFNVWRYEIVEGRLSKIPYDPHTGKHGKSNDPSTFSDFETATDAALAGGYDGVGIGLFKNIVAIDIDDCVDENEKMSPMATAIMDKMQTYTEYSPSGRGLRCLARVSTDFKYDKSRYYINSQKLGLEIYVAGYTSKYLTITGNTIWAVDETEERDEQLLEVLETYMVRPKNDQPQQHIPPQQGTTPALSDDEVIRRASEATDGEKFQALMDGDTSEYDYDASRADMAACGMLSFWTSGNPEQIDRIFRRSGLFRDKWDRITSGGLTYGAITINKALQNATGFYDPSSSDDRITPAAASAMLKKALAAAPVGQASSPTPTATSQQTSSPAPAATSQQAGTSTPAATSQPARTPGKTFEEKLVYHLQHVLAPFHNPRYSQGDMGNGNLFADCFSTMARYVPERKTWFYYDGIRWRQDTENLHTMELCKKLADALMKYMLQIAYTNFGDDYQEYFKEVERWQRRGCRETILKDAASVHPVSQLDFDKDPYSFNCLNGTLDLRTGEFKPHDPDDLLSKVAGVHYDPLARCVRWEKHIDEIMGHDTEKAEFLQKALGYSLTGDTRQECFFILYGATSRNGKGVTMETIRKLIGGYGQATNPETITQKQTNKGGSGPSEDIARLAGARLVNISEPDKKMVLSSALVKTLTGNDTITARYLHENSFEYRPQFKLFVNTNYLPRITDATVFASGRVKVIPFERHFEPHEQDKGLKRELAQPENLSGILNWCIQGLQMMMDTGLEPPDSVLRATGEYQKDSDKISRFVDETMVEDAQGELTTTEAYEAYRNWCQNNGHYIESSTTFKKSMELHATVKRTRPKGNPNGNPVWLILGLRWA